MKVKTFLSILCSFFYVIASAQTVPVTIYRDARHSPYQTVITYEGAVLNDDDGDREFEATLDLEPGIFEYGYWTDNSLAVDPDNPRQRNGAGFSILTVSDPMISYLLPIDGGVMQENRIRADLAYTAANPPLAGTMSLLINGSAVSNPESYFDAAKRRLLLPDPPSLVDGENTVTFSYETNAGEISRSSTFSYHPIVLKRSDRIYRMEQILAWGRVLETPCPATVFLQCDGRVYEADVNAEGYFGQEINIKSGKNTLKVAYTSDGLNTAVDEIDFYAELSHSWWVELSGSLDAGTATVSAVVHGIDAGELSFSWSESSSNPASLGIGGSASSVSFSQPATEGEYQVELQVTATDGTVYTARTIFLQDDDPHFLGLHERAPWMEEMVLYETEDDYYTWGCYSFTKMKEVLPHMKKLGLNALMLPPFNAGGYVTHDHFQLNTGFGTKEELIALVDAAHALGIRIIFDVALGHSNNDNPFLRSAYYVPGNSAPYDDFYEWSWDSGQLEPEYSEQGRSIVHMNLGSDYVREYVIKLMEFWMEEFGIDGYRYDSGQESIERAPEFMTTLLRRLKNIKPDCWLLVEGDDRDHADFSFYDYADAGYNWKLNSEWGDGGQGLPGVYKGMYSLDQLDALQNLGISGAAPKKGLLWTYANVDYHPYFHDRYGWEQEKAALSMVFTTYGLPGLWQGEEVGAERAGGHFDYDDPMGMMPFYSRLIHARKYMLGNYPEVSRLSLSNSSDIYAFTAWRDTSMTLTVINFTAQSQTASIALNDAAFQGKVSQFWSEITDLDTRSFSGDGSTDVVLEAFESKVFLLNTPFDQVFPPLGSIQLISQTGESSISEDGGSLQLEVVMDPECSIEELEWVLEGDTHLASISNGLLQTCGCGEGLVTVTVRSKNNPTLSDHMDIAISPQSYGQILNPGFDEDITEWRLFGFVECNSQAESVNGEAHITIDPHEGGDCGVSMGIVNYLDLQQGKTYRLSFDARSSSDNILYAKIWKSEDGWAQFFWDQFGITTSMQRYSTEFTREEADTKMGQLLFDFTGNGDEYWIDNVSFCEVTGEEEEEDPQITFRVDMQNEEVSPEGVYVIGDWDPNNQWATPLQMSATGSVYSFTVSIPAGKSIQYKFKNGQDWENPTGDCLADDSDNRVFTVGTDDEVLPLVCYNSCEACESTGLDQSAALVALELYPNPTRDVLYLDGLPDGMTELRVYDMQGRLVFHEETPASPRMEVDMGSYPNGIYALTVWSPETQESHTFRVVKE